MLFDNTILDTITSYIINTIIGALTSTINNIFGNYDISFLNNSAFGFTRAFLNYFFPMGAISRAIIIYCGIMAFVFVYNVVLRIKGFIPTESEG